jgi:hypothetical protein
MKTNIFYVSGTVFQKVEWRTEILNEGGIPKYYEVYNFLSTSYHVSIPPHFPSNSNDAAHTHTHTHTHTTGTEYATKHSSSQHDAAHTHTHTHTHHRSAICRQTPVLHTVTANEPVYVISIKHRTVLPDDGSFDPKHVGVILNVCFLDF